MADLGQALATGGTALVSAAAGAGLTYWLGALNRRHQEAREDRTRWYEARLEAYIKLYDAMADMTTVLFHPEEPSPKARWEAMEDLRSAQSRVRLVGSPDFYEEADGLIPMATRILNGPRPPKDEDEEAWVRRVLEIEHLARQDLGYPDTWFKPLQWAEEVRKRIEREERAEEGQ